MSDEEWGPWIEHDGKGCPVRAGSYIQVELSVAPTEIKGDWVQIAPRLFEGWLLNTDSRNWSWIEGFSKIIMYRVKKPKGLKMLEELIQNLPAPTKEMEKT